MGSGGEVVVFVEMFGFGEGREFLCVLLQKFALETGQIVHQYIYYKLGGIKMRELGL